MFKNRQIGDTGLEVSELGFGAASLGNLYKAISDNEAQETLDAAKASGINLYDTAPRYGLGLSERRLGDALRTLPKSDYVISTKVGRILTPDHKANVKELRYGFDTPMPFDSHYDYTYDGIMRSFEDSLQRLGLAQIDILLVHDIGVDTHGEQDPYYYQQLASSGYKALDELRSQGVIKAVGLGVNETEICERVMGIGQFDCFLLAGRYSLLEQDALDTFLPQCEQHGASIILGGPYNSGILATGVKNSKITPYYNYEPAPAEVVAKVNKIEDICAQFQVPLAAAALQFPLGHSAVSTVIPGLGSAKRVDQAIELFNYDIPKAFWTQLKDDGLLRQDAPLPTRDAY
ncbi:aldo/keto reductase [Psychrosphaera sp. B3R10]|uniref:aldo/keto reductase n=1 Tax=unclassified Psychrosphaera TaxID=2641570 RepID=UPI001C0A5403|nr:MULTISPECIES: aldo/keto reductase [unclassified Psychrosphaera]MBU2882468.1 aldo/keto reductase [Psychrosphaera sp. I2R16]MBU2990289.1 aldo/keto reductase [Psychrosphaera sp. B3R10]